MHEGGVANMQFHNFFTLITSVLYKYVPMILLHSVVSVGQGCVFIKKTNKQTMQFKGNKSWFFSSPLGLCNHSLHSSFEDHLHLRVFWLQGAEEHGPEAAGDPVRLRGGEQPRFIPRVQ